MPAGTDSIAGDRGVALSQGERQRLSIARACLRRPRLLVLDEAPSFRHVPIDYDGLKRTPVRAVQIRRRRWTTLGHQLSFKTINVLYITPSFAEGGRTDDHRTDVQGPKKN